MEEKPSGVKLTRSKTVTVKLDPKMRYLAGLAARSRGLSMSSHFESILRKSVALEDFRPTNTPEKLTSCIADIEHAVAVLEVAATCGGSDWYQQLRGYAATLRQHLNRMPKL